MSVCIFVPVMILRKGNIGIKTVISMFFPTIFGNNWYMSCYILFCLVYPFLNQIINSLDQRGLLWVAFLLGSIYTVLCLFRTSFFPSQIIVWIAVYFVLAYIKVYMPNVTESTKCNLFFVLGGVGALIAMVLATNFLGLKFSLFKDKNLRWNSLYNPFSYIIALGLLNLFRKLRFHNKLINGLSKLSFTIYLFHENVLLRDYYRPWLWHQVYHRFGYSHVVGWALLMVLAIFAVSVIVCLIYSKTVQVLTHKVCDKIYFIPKKARSFMEERIFKVPKAKESDQTSV